MRKKYRLAGVSADKYDEYADDVLNFKDSERDSIVSYMEDDEAMQLGDRPLLKDNTYDQHVNMIDTPTRLVNHSNEFLPKKKKIAPEKLAKRAVQLEL